MSVSKIHIPGDDSSHTGSKPCESILAIIIVKFKPVFLNQQNTSLKGDAHSSPQIENIPL